MSLLSCKPVRALDLASEIECCAWLDLQIIGHGAHGEVATQVLTGLPLAYMCGAAYFSLFKMVIFSYYQMVPKATDPVSLLLNAGQVCRFAAPLAYNFMHVIRMNEVIPAFPRTASLPPDTSQSPLRCLIILQDEAVLDVFMHTVKRSVVLRSPSINLPLLSGVLLLLLSGFVCDAACCVCRKQCLPSRWALPWTS